MLETDTQPTSSPLRTVLEERGRNLGEFDRVHVRDFSPARFRKEYMRLPGRPVVIEGALEGWRAREEWTFDFFRERFGDARIPVGVVFEKKGTMRLAEYVDYLQERSAAAARGEVDDLPKYLEGWYFKQDRPELADYYDFPAIFGPCWFKRYFPKAWDPDGVGILIGPRGALTKLHNDGQSSHNMLAQLQGRKEWVVVDPAEVKGVFKDFREDAGGYPGLDHPALVERVEQVGYTTATIGPGDLVFIPSRFYHMVRTIEDSISLTYNFMNGTNARRVLWDLFRTRVRNMVGRG